MPFNHHNQHPSSHGQLPCTRPLRHGAWCRRQSAGAAAGYPGHSVDTWRTTAGQRDPPQHPAVTRTCKSGRIPDKSPPTRTVDRSFKVDGFTHSNGTSLTSHVLLLRSGLCDGSMDVTARRHSTSLDTTVCSGRRRRLHLITTLHSRRPRKHENEGHTHAWHLVEALCVSGCILDAC